MRIFNILDATYCVVSVTASFLSSPRQCVTQQFAIFSPIYVDGNSISIKTCCVGPSDPSSFIVDMWVLRLGFLFKLFPAIVSVR